MLRFTGVSVQIDIIEKLDVFLVLMVQRLIKEEMNRDMVSL